MIQIKKLTKKFGEHEVFHEFDMDIEEGELLAIQGASGCGKSTILNILGLLDDEYEGAIEVDGQSINKKNEKQRLAFIRDNINYLFQNYALVNDMTVFENLKLALTYAKVKESEKSDLIVEALHKVGLSEESKKKVYTLSGGEQQRVALARLLLKPGKYILADEPTGNLDSKNRDIVLQILKELNKTGKTVIIVTHDPVVAKSCHRVIQIARNE